MSTRHYSYVLGYTKAKFRTCITHVIKNICALHIITLSTSYQYDSFLKSQSLTKASSFTKFLWPSLFSSLKMASAVMLLCTCTVNPNLVNTERRRSASHKTEVSREARALRVTSIITQVISQCAYFHPPSFLLSSRGLHPEERSHCWRPRTNHEDYETGHNTHSKIQWKIDGNKDPNDWMEDRNEHLRGLYIISQRWGLKGGFSIGENILLRGCRDKTTAIHMCKTNSTIVHMRHVPRRCLHLPLAWVSGTGRRTGAGWRLLEKNTQDVTSLGRLWYSWQRHMETYLPVSPWAQQGGVLF